MLTFYYSPVSGNSRRVWMALLEKHIPFEPIAVRLDGEQLAPDFTAINPLQRVPVIIDDGFRVIESLAILDFLEAKYPTPPLLPSQPEAIATVRMVEMLVINELHPAVMLLTRPMVGLETDPAKGDLARERITAVLQVFEALLGSQPYFAGADFTLADIVAGIAVSFLERLQVSFAPYPRVNAWLERFIGRDSWRQTTPPPEVVQAALPTIRQILERRF